MKERYYYLRKGMAGAYPGLHRCGVVFLIAKDGKVARGISLCNDKEDPFLRDEGLLPAKEKGTYTKFIGGIELAKRRAQKALISGRTSLPIQRQEAMDKVYVEMFNKSEFMPFLTGYEKKLLDGGVQSDSA